MTADDNFNAVVSYWEEERNKLTRFIENYIREQEYELAHFHQQALIKVNLRIQTLKNFEDKLYDQKLFKLQHIDNLRNLMEKQVNVDAKLFLKNEITKEEHELRKLNELPRQDHDSINQNLFRETIISLLKNEIRGFRLILNKTEDFVLTFSYRKNNLTIKLPRVKQHLKRWMLDDERIAALEHTGFRLHPGKGTLALTLTGDQESLLQQVLSILSHLVFEIFYFKMFNNETFLEIIPKTKRTSRG